MKICPGETLEVGHGSMDNGIMGENRKEGTKVEERGYFINLRVYFPCETIFQRTGEFSLGKGRILLKPFSLSLPCSRAL